MGMTYIHRDRSLTLAITGEVAHHHARALMAQIDRQIDRAAPKRVTMDLSGVTFMDSSGIALVLRVYKRAGEWGGEVAVTPDKWYGVTYQADRPVVVEALARLTREGLYPAEF